MNDPSEYYDPIPVKSLKQGELLSAGVRLTSSSVGARRFLVSAYRGRIAIAQSIVLIQFALFA